MTLSKRKWFFHFFHKNFFVFCFLFIYFPNKVFLTGMYGFRIEIHKRSEWVSWIFTKLFIFITNKYKKKVYGIHSTKVFFILCVFEEKVFFTSFIFSIGHSFSLFHIYFYYFGNKRSFKLF